MMNSQSIPQEAHVAASVLSWPKEPGKPAQVFVPASLCGFLINHVTIND